MPVAPFVVAYATRTFAPVSKRPIATSAGRSARGGRSDLRVTKTAAATASDHRRRPGGHDRPGRALVGPGVEPDEEEPEAERGDDCKPRAGSDSWSAAPRLAGQRDDPGEDERDTDPLCRCRDDALGRVDRQRDEGRRGGDRRDDPHRAYREPAVQRGEPDRARQPGQRRGKELADAGKRIARQ